MHKRLKQMAIGRQKGIFQPIVEAVSRTMNLPVSVWVPDEQGQVLRIAAAVRLPSDYVREAFLSLSEESVTGESFKIGKVIPVRDVLSEPRWKHKKEAQEAGWKSVLCVPIQAHGAIIGVINIYAFEIRDFSDAEKQLLKDYATQIGLALEAERRGKTLTRLLDIGDKFALLVTKEPKCVLQEIAKGACEVTGADCAVTYPYDDTREEVYNIEHVAHYGLRYPLELKDKPRIRGLGAYVVSKGEVVVSDIGQEDHTIFKGKFLDREDIKAFVGIALKMGERVLGILYVNFRTLHWVSEEEQNTIRLFAHQAAIAIDNSRLYQQASTRAEALKRLHEVGSTLGSVSGAPRSLKNTLKQIVQNARRVLGADLVDLYQYIQSQDEYVLPPIQVGKRYDLSVRKDRIYEDDVVRAICKNRQPQYFPEAQIEESLIRPYTEVRWDAPPKRFVIRERIRATAAVPLIVGAEVVGVLFANYRSQQTFPQHQQELIELFASQAAIAIRNARVFEQRRALQNMARDITRILDKDELLQRILIRSLELLGCEIGAIALLNKITNKLEFKYAVGKGKETHWSVPFSEGLIGTAAATRKPVCVGDVTKDSRYIEHVPETRSELDVPMLIGNELIGVLNAESTLYNAFDEDSEALAVTLAGHAAVALYNAALFEQLSTLVDFGQAVTSGIRLREDEVLRLIYDQASKLMDTGNMYIALYDETTDIVRFPLAFVDGELINIESRKAGKGRTEEIIHTRKPIFHATKAEAEAWYVQPGHEEYTHTDIWASWLGVPMTVGKKVLGVIATYHPTRDYVYSGDDLALLQAIANQAAIALDNANMFYDVNCRLEALVEFGRAVTSMIRLSEDEVLRLIYDQASKLMDTGNVYIALYDETTDIVRFPLAFVDGELINIESRKAGKGRTEEIIRSKKPMLTATKAEAEVWYAQPEHKEYWGRTFASWLGVPMMVGERILGVIATYHPTVDYVYSGDDLVILQAMANQAAVALDNARLYEDARKLQDEVVASTQLATLGTALAGLQHRINNTFNIIIPNVTRLRNRVDMTDQTLVEILDIIERSARYTSEMITRIQEPLREIEIQDVDVNAVLIDVVGKVGELRRADPACPKVEVTLGLDDSIPQIRAPIGQVAEVFRNLIDNSYRAMKDGGKLVVTSRLTDETICVRVQDTGPGIPPHVQQRLFVRPVPSEDPGGGAGLGLWLSKLLLQSIGGSIVIEKAASTGTTMLVQIPAPTMGKYGYKATHSDH